MLVVYQFSPQPPGSSTSILYSFYISTFLQNGSCRFMGSGKIAIYPLAITLATLSTVPELQGYRPSPVLVPPLKLIRSWRPTQLVHGVQPCNRACYKQGCYPTTAELRHFCIALYTTKSLENSDLFPINVNHLNYPYYSVLYFKIRNLS